MAAISKPTTDFSWRAASGTFAYTPDIAVYVATEGAGVQDLTRHIQDFVLNRRTNAESTFSCTIDNKHGRWDRVIGRMDKIVVFLKRVGWLQCFAGYVTTAPYETVVPGAVTIEATCTLKRLEHTFWDPYSPEAQLFYPGMRGDSFTSADGGAAAGMFRLLTKVVKWAPEQIFIQKIPEAFINQVASLVRKAINDLDPMVVNSMNQLFDAEGFAGTTGSPSAKWSPPGGGSWMAQYGPGAPGNGKIDLSLLTMVYGVIQSAGCVRHTADSYYLRPDAALAYFAMQEAAKKDGLIVNCITAYRTVEEQQCLYDFYKKNPSSSAYALAPGQSPHGAAISIDISPLGTPKAWSWAVQNGGRFGFSNHVSGDLNHFNYDPANDSSAESRQDLAYYQRAGIAPSGEGGGGSGAPGGPSASITPFGAIARWYPTVKAESAALTGDRAWINDESVLGTIQTFAQSSLRDFQSSPTGDFIAWFPDRFGVYGKTPALKVRDIEIMNLKIGISDGPLTTHVAVAGDFTEGEVPTNLAGFNPEWVFTAGMISVQQEDVMKILLGLDPKKSYTHLDGEWILQKFGLRPLRQEAPLIRTKVWEFVLALRLFMQKWSEQFMTTASFTFLPEMYPGMRVELADRGIAMYVEQVTHQGSRQAGFTTTAQVSSPMRRDGKGGWALMELEQSPRELSDDDVLSLGKIGERRL